MAYRTYTKDIVGGITGRPGVSYTSFLENSAIPQALLLFKMGTCLASPDDLTEDQKKLVDFAVVYMADAIYLSQPFAQAAASPFSSESIGSYSYSKAAKAVQRREETGIMWFDLAIAQLSVCEVDGGDIMFGGVDVWGMGDGALVQGRGNVLVYLTPEEVQRSAFWGHDPSNGYVASSPPALVGGGSPSEESPDYVEDPENPGFLIP